MFGLDRSMVTVVSHLTLPLVTPVLPIIQIDDFDEELGHAAAVVPGPAAAVVPGPAVEAPKGIP